MITTLVFQRVGTNMTLSVSRDVSRTKLLEEFHKWRRLKGYKKSEWALVEEECE